MIGQRTLKNVIRATGVGLHTGEKVYLCLRPAPVDTGIVFVRSDLDEIVEIPARAEFVGDTRLATTLVRDGVRVSTVEHLMAAFAGLGIDNAYVEVSAPEVPIMDGSAAPFVFLLQSAGIEEQGASKRFLRMRRPVEVQRNGARACLLPFEGFKVSCDLVFDHPVLARHSHRACVDFSTACFVREVARARTFGFLQDFEKLQSANLAPAGRLDHAVLMDDDGILNEGGLRQEDEFARHTILDVVGDLYLLGHGIIGEYRGRGACHALNHALREALLAAPDAWELVAFENADTAPVQYASRPAVVH